MTLSQKISDNLDAALVKILTETPAQETEREIAGLVAARSVTSLEPHDHQTDMRKLPVLFPEPR